MTAPTSALAAASKAVRAMSNVWARRLMAGTVKPDDLAAGRGPCTAPGCWPTCAPSAWLASQTSHCAAAVVASSVDEGRGPGEVADGRRSERGLVVDDEDGRHRDGRRRADRREQVGGRGRDVGHRWWVSSGGRSASWYGASRPTTRAADRSDRRLDDHQEHDRDEQRCPGSSRRAGSAPTRASSSGGGPRRPGGGGADEISITRSTCCAARRTNSRSAIR